MTNTNDDTWRAPFESLFNAVHGPSSNERDEKQSFLEQFFADSPLKKKREDWRNSDTSVLENFPTSFANLTETSQDQELETIKGFQTLHFINDSLKTLHDWNSQLPISLSFVGG